MNKIGLSKWKQLGILFVAVMLLSVSIAGALTRRFSGYGDVITDNSGGMIAAYNGDNVTYYSATNLGLINVINNYNETGATIELPINYINLENDIYIDNLSIIGKGSGGFNIDGNDGKCFTQINLTGNNTIILGEGGSLHNIQIYTPTGHGTDAIRIINNNGYSDYSWGYNNVLSDIYVCKSSTTNGTAINLTSSGGPIALCSFNDIQIKGFKFQINVWNSGTGYVNGNIFNNLFLTHTKYGIHMYDGDDNTFNNVQFSPDANAKYAIYMNGTGAQGNRFTNLMIWDWNIPGTASIKVDSDDNYFSGYIAHSYGHEDTGDGNTFELTPRENNKYIIYPNNDNDGDHIENAVNDLTDGATVIFMGGTYDIDETVTFYDENLTLIASNDANFRFQDNFPESTGFIMSKGSSWSGGVFDGNNANQYGTLDYIFSLEDNCTLKDMTIKDFNTSAVYFYLDTDCLLDNIIFIGGTARCINIRENSHNCTIRRCDFINDAVSQYCINIDDGCKNIIIDNNDFFCNKDIINLNGAGHIITNNCFRSNEHCIILNGNATITDNIFYESGGVYAGVRVEGYNTDSIVKNNIFTDGCGNSITFSALSQDCIIKDNLGYNHNSLFPFYEQTTAPSVNDNCTAYWYDTNDNYMYQVVNTYGTVYYVNMTTSI